MCDAEDGRYCEGPGGQQALIRSRSGPGRLQDDARKTDRRVTPKALLSRRIDGSGQSRTPPATTYSLFTANGSTAQGRIPGARQTLSGDGHHVGLDNGSLLMEGFLRGSRREFVHRVRARTGPIAVRLQYVRGPWWTLTSGVTLRAGLPVGAMRDSARGGPDPRSSFCRS